MAEHMSLLEFIREMLTNVQLREHFDQEPAKALHAYGLDDVDAGDVHDALTLVREDQSADFGRHYDTGWNGGDDNRSAPAPAAHESAAEYINRYVTNNHVDDRDTTVDNSTNQQIDTHGGDFDQDVDVHSTVASGNGSVAAGGDIDGSTVTTGHDNQVGDGDVRGDGNVVGDHDQAVTGDHDTSSFGAGHATGTTVGGDVNVGTGGAFASGGDAAVDNSDNSLHNVDDTATDESVNGSYKDYSDHSTTDSHNSSTDESTHGSHDTDLESTTKDSYNEDHTLHVHH